MIGRRQFLLGSAAAVGALAVGIPVEQIAAYGASPSMASITDCYAFDKWVQGKTYQIGDMVMHAGGTFICVCPDDEWRELLPGEEG